MRRLRRAIERATERTARKIGKVCRKNRGVLQTAAILAVVIGLRTAVVHAGTDVTFDDLNILLEGWTKGSLGKALALIALILGIGVAAARQSFAALFAGVGVAAGASIGPGVVSGVITAVF